MAFITHAHQLLFARALPLRPPPRCSPRPAPPRLCLSPNDGNNNNNINNNALLDKVPKSPPSTQTYGADDDVCTFGDECALSDDVVSSSPALHHLVHKYVLPMREDNTQVFFDNSLHAEHTLMLVFANDRHGLVLDVVSVLKALSVRVHRVASAESDTLRLLLARIEGELRSVADLGLSLSNCVAFWISDELSGDKIFDDGLRLDQLTSCVKLELNTPYPRPRPARPDAWHRVSVQKNRNHRFTVFSVQTSDRPRLLSRLTAAFAALDIDVASASIQTFSERVENTFFVTKSGFKQPLTERDIMRAMKNVLAALLAVGDKQPSDTLWYQLRDGSAVLIAEAIFIDEVNNRELAMFRFSQFETPNFRGRLPDAPYRPIIPQP